MDSCEHTLLTAAPAWAPEARPVHRLGRFTSGLLVCARQRGDPGAAQCPAAGEHRSRPAVSRGCLKVYRALTAALGGRLGAAARAERSRFPIGRRPHALLGQLWCAGLDAPAICASALESRSALTLLERRPEGCLVEVEIATGRPHQIRIHTAALGSRHCWGIPCICRAARRALRCCPEPVATSCMPIACVSLEPRGFGSWRRPCPQAFSKASSREK